MSTLIQKSHPTRSLVVTLAIAFLALSVGVLLISGGLQIFLNLQTQQQAISDKQQVIAQEAANTVASFIQEKFSVLETTVELVSPTTASPETQYQILESLLGLQPAFRQLVLFDAQNRELVRVSRLSQVASGQFAEQLKEEVLGQVQQRYISPVYIDPVTSEPMVVMAVPAINALGDFEGILVVDVSLKFMWDLVDQLKVGETGQAYVVDRQGNLIAFWDSARVLKGENVSQLKEVSGFISNSAPVDKTGITIAPGIEGTTVVGTYVPLGTPDWAVVTELPWMEAYREVINGAIYSVVIMIVMAAGASLIGVVLARRLAVPLVNLTDTATRIAEADLNLEAAVEGPSEVVRLSKAFNSMTAQLRGLINGLEERVADRTRRLEIVATLGEQLNAILDADELLREVVNQIKQNFGYYHTHIYLLDDSGENLIIAAGTGSAGEKMRASNHSISLKAKSLVARAARFGETVTVDDVQAAQDWLPNPLLPDTRAEMAVPIMQTGEVIGVLDVQEDKVGGLDESDANLLRSLANQVAVALSNARLFKQTTQAKEEADQAREEAEQARADIEIANRALEAQVWQTTGQAQLNDKMQGEQDMETLANSVIQQLCQYLEAQIGALYVVKDKSLMLVGRYAYASKSPAKEFNFGEGLVGQAALEKRVMIVADVPKDYITVSSALGETVPRTIMVFPVVYENRVVGVIELGTLAEFTQAQTEFMQAALNGIAIAFNTAQARDRINELLVETQQQAEELQTQGEELRVANEELEAQTKSLRISETQLREKQAELEAINTQLEEKAAALEKSSTALREKQTLLDQQNQDLKVAQEELERKAEELALASKYK
ncbi:MAG: GAF domain-containing protein, partial [Anaerolineae bacterium]|nr:GAF domain-containing protein [Anaerolineae bacterium]